MSEATPRLMGDALISLLAVVKDADSIELKLTIPESSYRSTVVSLGVDALNAQLRQVYFLDTPDLQLDAAGVVARFRRVQGRRSDSVIKLRPVVPSELDPALRASPDFGVEVDAMPGGYVCSASMKHKLSDKAALEVAAGTKSVRKLFSPEQRAFYSRYAPSGLQLGDLSILGPILVLKLAVVPAELGRSLVGELWLYPDGSRVLELSTKCGTDEGLQVAAQLRGYLESKGANLDGVQQTKTRMALDFFSAELRARTS